MGDALLATYHMPDGSKVMTREVSPTGSGGGGRRRITLEQLFAHRVHGVDNTGNVKVWPAEQALLRLLLARPFAPMLSGARVLELGAGMSGLAGLGVAACSEVSDVVITDGNLEAVRNLQTCVGLNERAGLFGDTNVSAQKLVWDRLDSDGARAQLLDDYEDGFDLVIASDCLFFKDFHFDLISTMDGLLRAGGRGLLVQPQRGGTANLFLQRIIDVNKEEGAGDGDSGDRGMVRGRLQARLVERYDERIWAMHEKHLAASAGDEWSEYLPDRHLPLLVEVFKPREGVLLEESKRRGGVGGDDGEGVWLRMFPLVDDETDQSKRERPQAPATNRDPDHSAHPTAEGSAKCSAAEPAAAGSSEQRSSENSADRPAERPDREMDGVYQELAERLRVKLRAKKSDEARGTNEGERGRCQQLWLAIAGAPGSGKTTLAAEVCRRVSAEFPAICVPMDGFHLYRRELDAMPDPEEAYRKRGAHWTFNGERFLQEVGKAKENGSGAFPGFDHAAGDPVEGEINVEARHALVIVEGNHLLLRGVDPWDGARELFDETWAIRCPVETCGERVRRRHIQTGLSNAEARLRVETNDEPNARLIQERCPWDEVDLVIDSL